MRKEMSFHIGRISRELTQSLKRDIELPLLVIRQSKPPVALNFLLRI